MSRTASSGDAPCAETTDDHGWITVRNRRKAKVIRGLPAPKERDSGGIPISSSDAIRVESQPRPIPSSALLSTRAASFSAKPIISALAAQLGNTAVQSEACTTQIGQPRLSACAAPGPRVLEWPTCNTLRHTSKEDLEMACHMATLDIGLADLSNTMAGVSSDLTSTLTKADGLRPLSTPPRKVEQFGSLPPEIHLMILDHLSNRSSLSAIVHASPYVHKTYLSAREEILTHVCLP